MVENENVENQKVEKENRERENLFKCFITNFSYKITIYSCKSTKIRALGSVTPTHHFGNQLGVIFAQFG